MKNTQNFKICKKTVRKQPEFQNRRKSKSRNPAPGVVYPTLDEVLNQVLRVSEQLCQESVCNLLVLPSGWFRFGAQGKTKKEALWWRHPTQPTVISTFDEA